MENATYHCEDYRLAKNRHKANTFRNKRSAWSKKEDRFILEHISYGALWMSHKINKSESAIRHRLTFLSSKNLLY